MDEHKDFTYDKIRFAGLSDFVKDLHKAGLHYIPIIDPGISGSEKSGSYPPYDLGVKMDIFVKNVTDQIFVGKVWNRQSTVWPDFTNPNAITYWHDMMKMYHDQVCISQVFICKQYYKYYFRFRLMVPGST